MLGPYIAKASNVYSRLPIKPFHRFLRYVFKRYLDRHSSDIVRDRVNGVNFELHLNERIEHNIYYNRVFEEKTRDALLKLVKPGMTIFDVGANIGVHTFYMAINCTPGGHVYAFEPATYAFKKLSVNRNLNPILPVTVVNAGLSDKNINRLDTEVACSWPMNKDFARRKNQVMPNALVMDDVIRLVKMDDFVRENNISCVDLIKLDIDGNEPKFLQGAKHTIKRDRPVIVFELADYVLRYFGASAGGLLREIFDLGYKVYNEDFVEVSTEIVDVISRERKNYSINLIAIYDDSKSMT